MAFEWGLLPLSYRYRRARPSCAWVTRKEPPQTAIDRSGIRALSECPTILELTECDLHCGVSGQRCGLWLHVNAWQRLALPKRIDNRSLTSLQQRLVKTGGRLVKHARYHWLPRADENLVEKRGRNGPIPGPPESLGMEEMRKTAPMEAVGSIIAAGQEAKTKILDEQPFISDETYNWL